MRTTDQLIKLIEKGCSLKIQLTNQNFLLSELETLSKKLKEHDKLLLEIVIIDLPFMKIKQVIKLLPYKSVCLRINPIPSLTTSELLELSNENIIFDFTLIDYLTEEN